MTVLRCALLCAAILAGLSSGPALAEEPFPNKPVTIVVTFPPGGGTDLLARLIGTELQKAWGQTVVVDNRAGASGNIGAALVARSAPDGYTLLMVNSSYAVNPGVFRKLPFDPKNDFAPVINVAFVPSVVLVPAESPYKSFKEVLGVSKAGTPLTFGSCGNGTPQHLAGEMINAQAGTALLHVPYKGCGPALGDLLGSQIPMAIVTASSAMPHIKSGKVRALAVTSRMRSAFLPDVPTVAEEGLSGYELDQWHGFLAPAQTPRPVIDKLNADIARIVKSREMNERLLQYLYAPAASTPEEFRKLLVDDIDRFAKVTQRIGLKME